MKKITVLGAGLVGKAIASDLSENFEVTSVDRNKEQLEILKATNQGIKIITSDVGVEKNLRSVIADADIVVGCLPGFMGYRANLVIINEQKPLVDISFFPEDLFGLDASAKKNNIAAIVDCGVAPGMGNIILGYHRERMKVQSYKCVVGGLPVVREWPLEYKAVFSPIDVIEEYIRPARYVENSKLVTREALSDPELMFFDGVGTLEAWNSDGLRSLIQTMPDIPDMIEKTMRYPGTIEYLRVLRECGFFSYDPVDVNGAQVRPIDITAKLLFPKWQLKPGEKDMTVMRITIEGNENGVNKRYTYDLYDEMQNNVISMARTTGYTCCAAVNILAGEMYSESGVCPPEFLGKNEANFNFIMNYLKERNIIYHCKIEEIFP